MTDTTQVATKKTRAKKGEGPAVFMYVPSEGEATSRIDDKTVGVKIADKHNGVVSFDLSKLPPSIVTQLAIDNLKRKLDTHIRTDVNEAGDNVISLANEAYQRLVDGKLYVKVAGAKKEGGGKPGRTFDVDLWVAILKKAAEEKAKAKAVNKDGSPVQPATDAQLASFKAKLDGMGGAVKERGDYLKKLLMDPSIALAKKFVEAQRIKDKAKADGATDKTVDFATLF